VHKIVYMTLEVEVPSGDVSLTSESVSTSSIPETVADYLAVMTVTHTPAYTGEQGFDYKFDPELWRAEPIYRAHCWNLAFATPNGHRVEDRVKQLRETPVVFKAVPETELVEKVSDRFELLGVRPDAVEIVRVPLAAEESALELIRTVKSNGFSRTHDLLMHSDLGELARQTMARLHPTSGINVSTCVMESGLRETVYRNYRAQIPPDLSGSLYSTRHDLLRVWSIFTAAGDNSNAFNVAKIDDLYNQGIHPLGSRVDPEKGRVLVVLAGAETD
jgi:hypothetical protein